MAKTETSANPLPRSFPLKSLGDFVGNMEEELSVCPVRALQAYISRTADIQSRPSSLFLSPKNPSKSISKNAISFFIRELITQSGAVGTFEGPGPRAHSVRSVATSLAFANNCSVSRILDTACWKSSSVFASYYLRDISHQSGEVRRIGPCVAAGQVIRQ